MHRLCGTWVAEAAADQEIAAWGGRLFCPERHRAPPAGERWVGETHRSREFCLDFPATLLPYPGIADAVCCTHAHASTFAPTPAAIQHFEINSPSTWILLSDATADLCPQAHRSSAWKLDCSAHILHLAPCMQASHASHRDRLPMLRYNRCHLCGRSSGLTNMRVGGAGATTAALVAAATLDMASSLAQPIAGVACISHLVCAPPGPANLPHHSHHSLAH